MDRDSVDAEVLFPAMTGQRVLPKLPAEVSVALTRGYNTWLSEEFCAADLDRLLGVAMIPVATIDDAIEELRRVHSTAGSRAVMLTSWPNGGPIPLPEDDRFWSTALELGVPLTAHRTFGGGFAEDTMANEKGQMKMLTNLMTKGGGPYAATQLINANILDRFPDLRIYFAATGIGWVPFYTYQTNDYYKRHRYWSGVELPHEPSWYVSRHFSWGFTNDPWGLEAHESPHADRVPLENLMWGSAFPGIPSHWPSSAEILKEQAGSVSESDFKKIKRDNAVAYFKLGS
jgi:predicted TIM-barrel fold metal-dependent hydrolase